MAVYETVSSNLYLIVIIQDSDLSVRTVGTNGRWEWRDRSPGEEWSESNRLSRRASHLDLRRNIQSHRRSGFYGSEVTAFDKI